MDRWTWMAIRIYAPAAGVLLLSLMLTVPIASIAKHAIWAGVSEIAWWATFAGMVVGTGMAAFATFRLWRWERGDASMACDCGGLLGRERNGRYGLYRKCFGCRKNVNERKYN